jgi:CRP/FNR family cyclic AMP-dependent transcriptional regulator
MYNKLMRLTMLAVLPTRKTDDESIIAHFSDGSQMKYSKNEALIHSHEEPQGVYLIKSGFVKAYSISPTGNENLLLIHKAGDFIPLPWALDGAHTTGLRYEAMTDVSVLRASKDRLRTALGRNPWLSQQIMNQAVSMLSLYTQRIQTLEYRTARARVISELIHLAERFGKNQKGEVLIDAPITHKDIADSINMTRETASRALELLFEEGYMGQKDHFFTIKDVQKLQSELD